MRSLLIAILRLILSSKLVSVVSGSPLLQRLSREEGSVQNSPLSLMSLWLGLIRLIRMSRILWSGRFTMHLITLCSLRWRLICLVVRQ